MVSCRLPSSVPTQIIFLSSGLGSIARIVVWFSAPVASKVNPPLLCCSCLLISLVVKSGEIIEFVDEEIEKLQKKVAEKHGYTLVDHKLELYGVKKKS